MNSFRALCIAVGLMLLVPLTAFAQAPEQPTQAQIDEAINLFNTTHDANLHKAAREWLVAVGAPAVEAFAASLDESVQDLDIDHDGEAIAAVGAIKAKPEIAVPVLIKLLKDWPNSKHAAEALAAYGSAAKEALPTLLKLMESDVFKRDSDLRMSVLRALCTIDQAAFAALPEAMQTGVEESLRKEPAGRRIDGYTFKELPVLGLSHATAQLEAEKANVAGFKEEPTPSKGSLSSEAGKWEVVRTQVPAVAEGVRTYTYVIRFDDGSKPVELVTASEEFALGANAYYFCDLVGKNSFEAKWLCPPNLIAVDWEYAQGPGTGYFTDAECLVLLKLGSEWKDVYGNRYTRFSRGGPDNYSHATEDLEWDSQKSVLRIRHVNRHEEVSMEPMPLSQMVKEEGYTSYKQEIELIAERLYQIKGDALEYIGGKRLLNPGDGKFKLSDIPLYVHKDKEVPAQTVARVRKLNPRFSTGDEFVGIIVLETAIPSRDESSSVVEVE